MRQALAASRLATSDPELHERVLRKVLSALSRIDLGQSPPAMAAAIHRVIGEAVGNVDPYRQMKRESTEFALSLLPGLQERFGRAPDPFETAVRLAIAGNVIDAGVNPDVARKHVREAVDWALEASLDRDVLERLRIAIGQAASILYLADNAGEIVFDRLLLDRLPADKVVLAVRGAPAINDATIEDAAEAGLTELVRVIDNGSSAPGTILEDCSDSFRRRFESADVVIAKGQGNYETLNDAGREIYFLFKVKCGVVARDLACDVGRMVVTKTGRA
jgi:uncharacterized protein with ATP-grasp and redox domains